MWFNYMLYLSCKILAARSILGDTIGPCGAVRLSMGYYLFNFVCRNGAAKYAINYPGLMENYTVHA